MLSSEVMDIEIENTHDKWKKSKIYELYKLAEEKIMLNDKIVKCYKAKCLTFILYRNIIY